MDEESEYSGSWGLLKLCDAVMRTRCVAIHFHVMIMANVLFPISYIILYFRILLFIVYLDRFIPSLVLLLLSLVNKRSWEGEGVNEEQEEQWRFLSEVAPFEWNES